MCIFNKLLGDANPAGPRVKFDSKMLHLSFFSAKGGIHIKYVMSTQGILGL